MSSVHLYTLGKLSLEGASFKEPMPLLVLAYLALQGKTQRGHLADLLWINLEEPKRRAVNLNEAVHRLRKLSPGIIQGEDWLETTATTDVQAFKKALGQGDIERALDRYQGHFLEGLERNPRLSLGEEINEWIINTREALYGAAFELRLELAECEAFAEKFDEAAERAWQTYVHSTNITYPSATTYQKLHTVLLGAERLDEAGRVLKEANELYGQGFFYACEFPAEARARLTHTYNFHAENPLLLDREKDIESILNTLQNHDHRLVSIIGPPGIGKTEVVQAVAQAARGQPFAKDGVHIVWLEALSAETPRANLLALISQALGVKAKTLRDLASAIGDSQRLLVLDNFEQLIKQHSSILTELYGVCPRLRMLVTSRELLRLEYEVPYLLSYLPRPKESSEVTLEQAHNYSSIELFELAAKTHGFKLTQDNLPSVIQLCQLVEGLPLGIKLAASWAGSLNPSDIAEKIRLELDLLSQSQGTARHDNIQATFDSSLRLLSDTERLAVMKLAVFQGEFALDAVEQVTGVEARMLRLLIEKSLLRYDQDTQRYSFHALIGQYVQDVLEQHPEVRLEVKTAHANYYLGRLEQLPEIEGEQKRQLMKFLGAELTNVQVAWLFAVEQGWFERLFVTCRALQQFGELTARYGFAESLLSAALSKCPEKQIATYTALAGNVAFLHYRLGAYKEAIELSAVAIGKLKNEAITNKRRKISLIRHAYITQLASYSSLAEFQKTLAVARELHDILQYEDPQSADFAAALTNLAIAQGNASGMSDIKHYRKALEIYESHNQQTSIAWVLVLLSKQLIQEGQVDQAEQLLDRASKISETFELHHWLSMSQYYKSKLAFARGDYDKAKEIAESLLIQAKRQNKLSLLAIVWRLLGEIEFTHPNGNPEKALSFFDTAFTHAHKISDVALINGILVDRLAYFLSNKRLVEASAIYPLVSEQVSYMYFSDKKNFDTLLLKYQTMLHTL